MQKPNYDAIARRRQPSEGFSYRSKGLDANTRRRAASQPASPGTSNRRASVYQVPGFSKKNEGSAGDPNLFSSAEAARHVIFGVFQVRLGENVLRRAVFQHAA